MSTGTDIIQAALSKISAHSVLQPAPPESIASVKDTLNGMLAEWEDDGIELGTVPLKQSGSELSEPLGTRNAIIYNLALAAAPDFPGSQVSQALSRNASIGYQKIKRRFKNIEIPKRKTRSTLPKGSGNREDSRWDSPFFDKGSDLG